MHIHHDKHHAVYVQKLNAALEGYPALQDTEVEELLRGFDSLPKDVQTPVRNHGGGHANHTLFWEILTANGQPNPSGSLLEALTSVYGSFDTFKETFTNSALAHFGSGWAWLIIKDDTLQITTTPNQDSPLMSGSTPIMGFDVWEHAYYLHYQNRRNDYIDACWNIINWDAVTERYTQHIATK